MRTKSVNVFLVCAVLLSIVGCSTVKEDWDEANRKNTLWSYQSFLERYPHSQFSEAAENNIASFIASLKKEQDARSATIWRTLETRKIKEVSITIDSTPRQRKESSDEIFFMQRGFHNTLPQNIRIERPLLREKEFLDLVKEFSLFTVEPNGLILSVGVAYSGLYYFPEPYFADKPYQSAVVPILSKSLRIESSDENLRYNLKDCSEPTVQKLRERVDNIVNESVIPNQHRN